VEKIESFGGRVEEMSPEGLVAMYGLDAIEDAARRAAHAALAIQKVAARANHSRPESSGVRVGLHVGEFLVTRVGNAPRVDHTAKRQAWERLEAFMGGAEAGTVLVSDATRPFLERRFVLAPGVAGNETAGSVWRLVGLEQTGLGLGERLTPFVARRYELNRLAQALEQARAGHGQVIGIVGEPGVGKSRVLWEFIQSQRKRDSLILITGAASYGKQKPYLPVIDLLKAYFKIEPRDEAERLREKVTEKVLDPESALAPALPALLALLDVSFADAHWKELHPELKRRRTLEAVKLLLLEGSRRQPIITVFEDLHWLDSETQAVLDSLVDSLPSHRVLLLGSFRPEYEHCWSGKTYYAQLRLDPLSRGDAHVFLDRLVGDDEATVGLKTALIEHTEGNPFFLEESVRTLVETGVLAGDHGSYRLVQPAGELQVPATIQAVLTARTDRLLPEDRALLQTAAVIGKDVPFALLQRVADLPEEPLRARLMRLQQGEFLYETRLVPELEYAFKHALTHEVAYRDLLQDGRRAVHARVLTAIEQLYGNRLGEQVDRLAHHAFRGEIWDKAAAYFGEAGVQAAARSAYREAVTRFEQALESLEHLPESRERIEQRIDLVLNLRNSLAALGEFQRLFEYLCEAKTLAEQIGDQRRLGWISAFIAHRLWELSHLDDAVHFCERALDAAASGDFALRIVASYQLGLAYLSLGELARAKEYLQSNIESLRGDLVRERFGEAYPPSVQARVWLMHVVAARGEFAEGIARGEEAVQIAQTVDDPYSLIAAHRGLGFLYLRKGDLDDAIRCLERSLELSQAWSIHTPGIFSYLGYAYALSGRLTDGLLSAFEHGLDQRSTSSRNLSGYAESLANLSEAYRLANREEDAIRAANQALEFARDHKRRAHEAWALRALGEIASHRDPPEAEKAEVFYGQALARGQELSMRPIVAHCHLGLGKLYGRVGKHHEACEHLTTAATLYREMGMGFWLEKTAAAMESSRL
jgi:tetratricopeptide (TPR) repeat protein